jgi:menaquinone-9 beta-reductase
MHGYDIVTVGGGLGGSAFAKAMAERGARVLVVERETQFKDRVRGEALAPWGGAEAKKLGIHSLLDEAGGSMNRYLRLFLDGVAVMERDLAATTPQASGWLTYYHPKMQELLIEAAAKAGAEVRRGARVRGVRPGTPAVVTIEQGGKREEISCRLVVAADGRGSMVRQWGGFAVDGDPQKLLFSGVLLEDMPGREDAFCWFLAPSRGLIGFIFPQKNARVRAYFGFHKDTKLPRLQGAHDIDRFKDHAKGLGFPDDVAAAKPAGPLATFEGADSFVNHPYKNGVALIGDAAATSDPTFGQGMSLTLRDVRVLCEALAASDDWDEAAHGYAEQHDRYYEVQRKTDGWIGDLFMTIGPEADALRARALPLIAQDPTRIPDCAHAGPEMRSDETARKRLFGEV